MDIKSRSPKHLFFLSALLAFGTTAQEGSSWGWESPRPRNQPHPLWVNLGLAAGQIENTLTAGIPVFHEGEAHTPTGKLHRESTYESVKVWILVFCLPVVPALNTLVTPKKWKSTKKKLNSKSRTFATILHGQCCQTSKLVSPTDSDSLRSPNMKPCTSVQGFFCLPPKASMLNEHPLCAVLVHQKVHSIGQI